MVSFREPEQLQQQQQQRGRGSVASVRLPRGSVAIPATAAPVTPPSSADPSPRKPSMAALPDAASSVPQAQNIPVVHDVSLTVRRGQLIGVCGAVAAGKSSLLAGILGQMKLMQGDVARTPRVAFVSQQAWIQTQSLRSNILFDKVGCVVWGGSEGVRE